MTSRESARTTATATVALLGALALLAGCSSDGQGNPEPGQPQRSVSTAPTGPASTPSPSQSVSSPTGGAQQQVESGLRVADGAERAVKGGTLFDLESDDEQGQRHWEAKVADREGRQFDLTMKSDGRVTDRREDATPDDDVKKLRSVTIPFEQAVTSAVNRARGKGDLSALEIDTADNNTVVWQLSFGGDDGVTATVDAASGKVLKVADDAG